MSEDKVIDCYAVLGVPRDATTDQIRGEWRKMQARYRGNAGKLRQVDAAAKVLLDRSKRTKLDESLKAQAAADEDSLDFSHIGPGKADRPAAQVDNRPVPATGRQRRKRSAAAAPPGKATPTVQPETRSARSIGVPVLIVVAIGAMIAFGITRESSKAPETPQRAAKPASPVPQGPSVSKAPQTYPPSAPKGTSPPPQKSAPEAATPESAPPRVIPNEFMQAFQKYSAKSGNKAIALALDNQGRHAFGSIAGHATQAQANEEALSECRTYKTQSGVQGDCRLYAVGDKVVW